MQYPSLDATAAAVGIKYRKRYAQRVALVREVGVAVPVDTPKRTHLGGPADVYRFMAAHAAIEPSEVLWLLPLNTSHECEAPVVVTRGTVDASLIHPREVFLAALAANAAAVVLVHNHPSGDPTPSAADRAVTDKLMEAGDLLGIPVYDHIVIGDGRDGRYQSLGAERAARAAGDDVGRQLAALLGLTGLASRFAPPLPEDR